MTEDELLALARESGMRGGEIARAFMLHIADVIRDTHTMSQASVEIAFAIQSMAKRAPLPTEALVGFAILAMIGAAHAIDQEKEPANER